MLSENYFAYNVLKFRGYGIRDSDTSIYAYYIN